MGTLLDAERCIVYVHSDNLLVTKAIRGANVRKFSLSTDRGIVGLVYTSRKGFIVSSPYSDRRFDQLLDQERKSITNNMLCVPIKLGETCYGCLEIANKSHSTFTKEDLHLATSVAKELVLGLINKNKDNFPISEFNTKQMSINILTPLIKNVMIILVKTLKAKE